jgi:ATP-dependent Clp protease ATP-binding subunit ClpA
VSTQIGFGRHERAQIRGAEATDEQIREVLRRERWNGEGIAPELFSRISHIVLFNQLTQKDLEKLARLKLEQLRNSALTEDFLVVEYDEQALAHWLIAETALPRDCRRVAATFERRIETPLARWRLQARRGDLAIMRLEPSDGEVRLITNDTPEARERAAQALYEQVAALFLQQQQREQQQRAARTLLGKPA